MIWTLTEYLTTIIECFIFTDFMVKFLTFKKSEHICLKYLIICSTDVIITIVLNNYVTYEGFLGIVRISFNFLLAVLFLKGKIFEKIFVSVIIDISVLLINFTTLNILGNLFELSFSEVVNNRGIIRLITLFITKFLFFLMTRILIKLKRKEEYSFSITEWLTLSIIFVTTMTVGIIVFRITLMNNLSSDTPAAISIGLCLILINIFIYILMIKMSRKNEEKKLLIIDQMQLEIYKSQLSESEKQYSEIKKIRHDIKNHLQCIIAFLDNSENEQAKKYINDILQNKLDLGFTYIKTGNRVIDAIANTKLQECRNCNIKTTVNISEFELNTENIDLCVILGNLFDNAIESCKKSEFESMICFEISQKKGYVNFVIKNTIENSVLNNNPELKTDKKDKHLHGIGIKSVRETIEKNGGIIEFYEKGDFFIADVWLLSKNSS